MHETGETKVKNTISPHITGTGNGESIHGVLPSGNIVGLNFSFGSFYIAHRFDVYHKVFDGEDIILYSKSGRGLGARR
jgi:hypothetical protein